MTENNDVQARILAATTGQTLFDFVVVHAANMRHTSFDTRPNPEGSRCMYRGPDDTECFVGCLLTDEEAEGLDTVSSEAVYGTSVGSLYEIGRLPERLRPHISLLQSLQPVHDSNEPRYWPNDLLLVARQHNLDPAKVRELEDQLRSVPASRTKYHVVAPDEIQHQYHSQWVD